MEPDDLALAALGEPVADDARRHLAGCGRCTAELAELSATVLVGRGARSVAHPVPDLVAPPASVWDRIRTELALPEGLAPDGELEPAASWARPASVTALATHDDASELGGASPVERPGTHEVGQLATRRAARAGGGRPGAPATRRTRWIAGAAAAGVVLGGAGGAWWAGRDTAPSTRLLAETAMEPLPGWEASGQARVEEAADGTRELVVTLEGGAAQTGFHEVWLIDRDVTKLVSLGVLEGSTGSFTVPDGLDLDEFPVVDVSEEQFDGDPTHSGDSIIRGILGA